jgi:hypothetical protein
MIAVGVCELQVGIDRIADPDMGRRLEFILTTVQLTILGAPSGADFWT